MKLSWTVLAARIWPPGSIFPPTGSVSLTSLLVNMANALGAIYEYNDRNEMRKAVIKYFIFFIY
jgi:hypothetical protein